MVIEHSVAIDPDVRYSGRLDRGVTVVNGAQHRPRIAGLDIFQEVRRQIPLDIVGMETEELGGLGDLPYRDLHGMLAEYRFPLQPHPIHQPSSGRGRGDDDRHPVVALATTELPSVIANGEAGYLSCDIRELVGHMEALLDDPAQARRMGEKAAAIAREKFSLDRFVDDWNRAFGIAVGQSTGAGKVLVDVG